MMDSYKYLQIIFYIVLIYIVNTASLYHGYPVFLAGFAFFVYLQTFGKKSMHLYSLVLNITIEIHFGFVLFSLSILYYIVDRYIMKFIRRHIKIAHDSIVLPVLIFYPFFIGFLFFHFDIDKQVFQNIAVNLAIDLSIVFLFTILLKNNKARL